MALPSGGDLSFFYPMGYQRNSCGYCKNKTGSASYYASSNYIRVEDYEELLNRGWRRSGTLYYKQNLRRSCCPHYTIRLNAAEYKPRRDQRKALHRWNRFILGQAYIKSAARLCPKTKEEKRYQKTTFDLRELVHEVEYKNVQRPIDPKTKEPIEPAHKFEVNIEPDSFSLPKFNLFLKYQTTIHKEPSSRWKHSDFKRFLCSGLNRKTVRRGANEQRLGSYHQCYRLDGKLVAVAVLDFLPSTISSVYIFYDPEYGEYEFGKLSAMREIELTNEERYRHYCMGFYIHSCPKMRYKGNFGPQFVLDPESLTWDPLDGRLRELLDKKPYVSLSGERSLASTPKGPSQTVQASTNESNVYNIDEDDEELSLFDLQMPGVLTLQELRDQIDLDNWCLFLHGAKVPMNNLVAWESSDIHDSHSLKGVVAELAATLGPTVVKNSAVVLSRN